MNTHSKLCIVAHSFIAAMQQCAQYRLLGHHIKSTVKKYTVLCWVDKAMHFFIRFTRFLTIIETSLAFHVTSFHQVCQSNLMNKLLNLMNFILYCHYKHKWCKNKRDLNLLALSPKSSKKRLQFEWKIKVIQIWVWCCHLILSFPFCFKINNKKREQRALWSILLHRDVLVLKEKTLKSICTFDELKMSAYNWPAVQTEWLINLYHASMSVICRRTSDFFFKILFICYRFDISSFAIVVTNDVFNEPTYAKRVDQRKVGFIADFMLRN